MKQKLSAIGDVAFYIVIPLIIWNLRGIFFGEYKAMLLSVTSSVLYTLVRFVIEKQFNFTGFFIISVLGAFMIMNIISTDAISIQYNNILLNVFIVLFYIGSIFAGRPCGKFFYRDLMKELGRESAEVYSIESFNSLTMVFALRDFTILIIRVIFIWTMGTGGIKYIIPITRIVTYIFILLIIRKMKYMSVADKKEDY